MAKPEKRIPEKQCIEGICQFCGRDGYYDEEEMSPCDDLQDGWIALIEWPVLTATGWIVLGLIVVFYLIFEILLFSLHWLLVAECPVESYRRSLLGFLINLCEVGIFFSIAYLLLGWFDPPKGAWSALFESISSVFSLQKLSGLREEKLPQALAQFQLVISWILVVFIVANVVGAIGRGEKKRKLGDDSV